MNVLDDDYPLENFNSGFRLRVKPQPQYDDWYLKGALNNDSHQLLYRLGIRGNTSEISPNKSAYIKLYPKGEFFAGNLSHAFGQGLLWSSPYGRMRNFSAVSSLIKDQFKTKSELSSQSKFDEWMIGNSHQLFNLKTHILWGENLQSIALKLPSISINFTQLSPSQYTTIAWNKNWNIINMTGEIAENNRQYAFIGNLKLSNPKWPTWLIRVKSIPQNWKTVEGKAGSGKSSNVNGILLHGIHKTTFLRLSGWINYETAQQQTEGILKDTKSDYMSQLTLGKKSNIQLRYRKIQAITPSSSQAHNGITMWQNYYLVDEWYKLTLKYIVHFETQFHFINGRHVGSLVNLNYLQKIDKNWQLYWGGHVCNLWDNGKFYLYQRGLDGEFLIQHLSQNQIKVYHIIKYQMNQTVAFSSRTEFLKITSQNESFNFSFSIQLDIVF